MSEILKMYEQKCQERSDINEHLPELRRRASECDSVVEFGVRNVVSTWAFLCSGARKVYSYDVIECPEVATCRRICATNNQHWEFRLESSLTAVLSEDVDMLFIDTLHNYAQVKGELKRHHLRIKKYIAFHDTCSFGDVGMDGGEGISKAIMEFMRKYTEWKRVYETDSNNGLLILKKVERKTILRRILSKIRRMLTKLDFASMKPKV